MPWKRALILLWTALALGLPYLACENRSPLHSVLVAYPGQWVLTAAQLPALWLASILWMTCASSVWQKIPLFPLRGRWLCGALCLALPVGWFFMSVPMFVVIRCR